MAIKTRDTVRLIQPEIRGRVIRREIGDDDATRVLVEWTDPSGEVTRRWFDETQLEQAQ